MLPLELIYRQHSRRIAYLHIEQQLHLRRIPYRTSSSSTSSAHTLDSTEVATIDPITHVVPSLATETPYLVLNSLDLLKASALPGAGGASGSGVGRKVAYPNVAITCVIKGEVVKVSSALGAGRGRRV